VPFLSGVHGSGPLFIADGLKRRLDIAGRCVCGKLDSGAARSAHTADKCAAARMKVNGEQKEIDSLANDSRLQIPPMVNGKRLGS
jgi:hypothetical protein